MNGAGIDMIHINMFMESLSDHKKTFSRLVSPKPEKFFGGILN